jgi:hypothetical protein
MQCRQMLTKNLKKVCNVGFWAFPERIWNFCDAKIIRNEREIFKFGRGLNPCSCATHGLCRSKLQRDSEKGGQAYT